MITVRFSSPQDAQETPEIRELESSLGIPPGYILGLSREYPTARTAHLYKGDFNDPGNPMCLRGWNRDDRTSYSIWRGHEGTQGVCRICMRRAKAGLDGVGAALKEAHAKRQAK